MNALYVYCAAAFAAGVVLEKWFGLVALVKTFFTPRPDVTAEVRDLLKKLAEREGVQK